MATLVIGHIARLSNRLNDNDLKEMGLGTAHLPVVRALKHGEGRTQRELAEFAQIEQPSMAQLLARMSRDGLVRYSSNPNDRRSSLISLTDKALQLMGPAKEVLQKNNAKALEGFTAAENTQLITLLHRLAENLESLNQSSDR